MTLADKHLEGDYLPSVMPTPGELLPQDLGGAARGGEGAVVLGEHWSDHRHHVTPIGRVHLGNNNNLAIFTSNFMKVEF